MRTRSLVVGYFHPIFLTNSDTPQIHATGGDVRRICDLFGITIATAVRYASTLTHPDLETPPTPVPETRDTQ